MEYARKIRLLNKLLAHSNPHSLPMCADAARGVETALRLPEDDLAPLGIFAKRVIRPVCSGRGCRARAVGAAICARADFFGGKKARRPRQGVSRHLRPWGARPKNKKKYKNPLFGHSNHRGFYFQIRKSPAQSRDSFYISIRREKSFSFANGGGRSLVLNV